jgi:inosine/guanosine/xanthosine phosphorylase family protein
MGDGADGAAHLRERLGVPRLGVVLGSGFSGLAEALGAGERAAYGAIPGYPGACAAGHDGGVAAATIGGARAWIFCGRLHMYQGLDAMAAAHPVRLLAAAGAEIVVLTCAAGGLCEDDRPGTFAIVTDHINLLGDDPIRHIPAGRRDPAFLDVQTLYDPGLAEVWRAAARRARVPMRDGVLAALAGPCYETPAEVRMLRALGADLASMSVVPEAILARYHGLRVAAVACISNRGAGLGDGAAIAHEQVLDVVEHAVGEAALFFKEGLTAMLF